MENQTQEQNLFEFRVDETGKQFIAKSAQWAMISVIASLVGYLFDLVQIFKPTKTIRYRGYGDFEATSSVSGSNILGSIIGLVIGLILTYILYQFANFAKKGLVENNTELLAKGFMGLKNYFLIYSILIIIVMAFLLLALLFVGAMGFSR